MSKKRRVCRHHLAGNQVMRPTDLGSNLRLRTAECIAQCMNLNLEHEFHHTASKLCILGFEPLK
jgi:hypothetical protein